MSATTLPAAIQANAAAIVVALSAKGIIIKPGPITGDRSVFGAEYDAIMSTGLYLGRGDQGPAAGAAFGRMAEWVVAAGDAVRAEQLHRAMPGFLRGDYNNTANQIKATMPAGGLRGWAEYVGANLWAHLPA